MITEDYVSFETAKLLKEKGFDEKCHMCWDEVTKTMESADEYATNSELLATYISAPTLQMAIKWLREKHNCIINIWYDIYNIGEWVSEYVRIKQNDFVTIGDCYTSYEQACEAAIKYCLENLI